MRVLLCSLAAVLAGCVVEAPAPQVAEPAAVYAPPPPAYAPEPAEAVSVYVEPPVSEPEPVAVGWAPPPLLVEVPPPAPFATAVWVGGYWVWQGDWVWAHGHWMGPPRPEYAWVHPYYEHRGGVVIFIDGHWSPPGVVFLPPPPGLRLAVETPAVGVIPGPRPLGPEGCFVPAPPGSRPGIIIPAPVGTAPAVVTSAPAVVAVGMRITNTTNVSNVTNVTNITNITRVTNVTIIAPAGATANGRAFNGAVPAAPHLAAARPALVQARAPQPLSARPVPTYVPGSKPPGLARSQPFNAAAPAAHPQAGFGRESARESGREPPPAHSYPAAMPPGANGAAHPQPQLAREGQPGYFGAASPAAPVHTPEATRPQQRPQERPQTRPQGQAAAAHPESGTPRQPENQPGRDDKKREREGPG